MLGSTMTCSSFCPVDEVRMRQHRAPVATRNFPGFQASTGSAAWGRRGDAAGDAVDPPSSPSSSQKQQQQKISQSKKGDGMILPIDLESSPRWRWPGAGPVPPPPPPPPGSSTFRDSPFNLFGSNSRSTGSTKGSAAKRSGAPPSRPRARGRAPDPRPSIQGLASRLFRNPEIRQMAQAELDAAVEAEEEVAATATRQNDSLPGGSSRGPQQPRQRRPAGYVAPPDVENIRDARQYKRQFQQWIDYKLEQRERQRFEEQEDEIWDIAKLYFGVSVVLIVLALASGL